MKTYLPDMIETFLPPPANIEAFIQKFQGDVLIPENLPMLAGMIVDDLWGMGYFEIKEKPVSCR